jgi:dTMP kinase
MQVGYFALEGGEGSGKSTQITLLMQRYAPEMVFTREPGGSEIGDLIRRELYNRDRKWTAGDQRALFTANRIINNAQIIRPAMESGHSVMTDRSFFSTMAYQCNNGQDGLHVEQATEYWNQILECSIAIPDIVFILDVQAEEGLRRRRSAGDMNVFDEMKLEQHRVINATFRMLPHIFKNNCRFVVIDASLSKEEIFRQITTEIDTFHASA